MKKNTPKLIVLLGALAGVVLLTAGVIYSYDGQGSNRGRSERGPAASPQILRQLLSQSAKLFTEQRYPEAERSLKRILNLDRDNIMAQRMLGNVYYMSGRYFEASNVFRAILAKFPKDPTARANLGETMIRMQWYEAGIRELLTARILDPAQPGIDLSLSRAYEELGDRAAAEHYLRLASERAAQQQRRMKPKEKTEEEEKPAEIPAGSPELNHEQN
ncbi:MAG: tetratricopeptide repeat protein [Lentisphaeria bacterium]|nr:tetratricopeptide repeat protein [Lentisphaeria bacterium]